MVAVFSSWIAILILHAGDMKPDATESSAKNRGYFRNMVASRGAKILVLLFLSVGLVFDGMYEGNLLTVGASYNLEKTNVNIRIYHLAFICKVGCTLLCWFFQFSYWMGEREVPHKLLKDLPTGYNGERQTVELPFVGDSADINKLEMNMVSVLQPEPGKTAAQRVVEEDVFAVNDITNAVVLALGGAFVAWMHFTFMFIEGQMLTPNTPLTDGNIIAITANVVCLVASILLVTIDATYFKKTHVGLKLSGIFGSKETDDNGLTGGQFWIYWPPLSIMAYELLALSAWTQLYNGFDHMIVYLAFRILCYVLVATSTSCATWLQTNLYVTTFFLATILFMPTTGGFKMDLGEKSNNTLSGPNVHYAMMMYFENTDMQIRSYATNYTVLVDSTTQGKLGVTSSALILSSLTLLSSGLRCMGLFPM